MNKQRHEPSLLQHVLFVCYLIYGLHSETHGSHVVYSLHSETHGTHMVYSLHS